MKADNELRMLWHVPIKRGDLNLSVPEPSIRWNGTETGVITEILVRGRSMFLDGGILTAFLGYGPQLEKKDVGYTNGRTRRSPLTRNIE